jgi:hypothetical protein
MPGEIFLDLEDVGRVHANGGNGGDDGKDTDMFFVHGCSKFFSWHSFSECGEIMVILAFSQ